MSAVKIIENEDRVNAHVSEASHVSQSAASNGLPDPLDIRRRARTAIRDIAHMLAIKAPVGLLWRREGPNRTTAVLDIFVHSRTGEVVLLRASEVPRPRRGLAICLVNWMVLLFLLQPSDFPIASSRS